jgi:hypothetical protein
MELQVLGHQVADVLVIVDVRALTTAVLTILTKILVVQSIDLSAAATS